ncbi:uncharacterized protein LOC128185386 [Crassostrea angulata]|uniref:uncharacterized protein LOC128185386 n=1 Tax=Magallana angulata TaxID=2784310 RepID=UPI0022B0D43E|nr:uncharacterized protein LOC128185386 [Crassostrea angulata]
MPAPANREEDTSTTQTHDQHEDINHLKRILEEKEKEIEALRQENEEIQFQDLENRRRDRWQIEDREEEIIRLQNAIQNQRPETNTVTASSPKVKLESYDGRSSIIHWWVKFMTFISLQKWSEKVAIDTLPFYLKGAAESWFYSVDDGVKQSISTIKQAIHNRFQESSRNRLELMDVKQKTTESVEDFIHRVTQMTTDRRVDQEWLITVIINGLKPDIGADVIKVDPRTLEELRNVAIRSEVAERRRNNSTTIQENTNLALLNALQDIRDDLKSNNQQPPQYQQQPRRSGRQRPPHPGFHHQQPQQQPRWPDFQQPQWQQSRWTDQQQPRWSAQPQQQPEWQEPDWQQPQGQQHQWQQPQWQHGPRPAGPPHHGPRRPAQSYHKKGEFCDSGQNYNNDSLVRCFYCRELGHFKKHCPHKNTSYRPHIRHTPQQTPAPTQYMSQQ